MQIIATVYRVAMRKPPEEPGKIIDSLVTFSEKARREGLLALEDDMQEIEDEFLKKGIQLVVDGTDPELVRKVLQNDCDSLSSRHAEGKGLFDNMATIAPGFGMIGTLIGLVAMLANLSDPDSIGPSMAVALITTFYGSVMANGIFLPTGNKLASLHEAEMMTRKIMIEGTISIQSGENPAIVKEKLTSFLSPKVRAKLMESDKGE